MRTAWPVSLFILVIACAGPGSPPTAASSPAASSSPQTSAVASPTASGVDFRCVLPVYGYRGLSTGAFISFPAAALTTATEGGYYYDRAVSRWLPVFRWAVSPDGLSYAYTEGWSASPANAPRLHIASAATRKDQRVVTMPAAQPYQVVDFTSTAVYLIISFEGVAPGVWRVDRGSGALAKISNGFYVPAGAAWIGVVDPRDTHPQLSLFSGASQPDRIDRRDNAGRLTTWFYAPGYALSWVGFNGTPALLVSGFHQDTPTSAADRAYWLVDGPGHATRLDIGQTLDLVGGFGGAIADAHGIWIGAGDSLYLVRRDGSVLRVFANPVYPANGCF